MRRFISNKMERIFKDFKNELKILDDICVLRDLRFDGGRIPDYNQEVIQQLYLLRYFPAYLVEYYSIYTRLIRLKFIDNNYKVLSIGSGAGLDYYGFVFAINKYEGEQRTISYTGVDKVAWAYRHRLGNKQCWFLDEDVMDWERLDEEDYNVVMFPKSIGEFTSDNFDTLEEIFRRTAFDQEKICLVSSIRDKHDGNDVSRLASIAEILEQEHSYICLDDKEKYWHFTDNVGLRKHFPDFVYPDHIKNFIGNSLIDNCQKYSVNWFEPCDESCEAELNRKPMLMCGYIKYQILRFEKECLF